MNELLAFEQRVRAEEAVRIEPSRWRIRISMLRSVSPPARRRGSQPDLRIDAELRDVPAQVFVGW